LIGVLQDAARVSGESLCFFSGFDQKASGAQHKLQIGGNAHTTILAIIDQ
jgi:hypothetical protein